MFPVSLLASSPRSRRARPGGTKSRAAGPRLSAPWIAIALLGSVACRPAPPAAGTPDAPVSVTPDVCAPVLAIAIDGCGTRAGFTSALQALRELAGQRLPVGKPGRDPRLAACVESRALECDRLANADPVAGRGPGAVYDARDRLNAPMGRSGMRGLADVYAMMGRVRESAGATADDIATLLEARARAHPEFPELGVIAASWLIEAGRPLDARTLIEPVSVAARTGRDAWLTARSLEFLGRALLDLGDQAAAEQALQRSLAAHEAWQQGGGRKWGLGCPYQAMGELYSSRGDLRRSFELLRRAADLEDWKLRSQVEAALAAVAVGDGEAATRYARRAGELGDALTEQRVLAAVAAASAAPDDRTKREAWFAETAARTGWGLDEVSMESAHRYARRAAELEPTPARLELEAHYRKDMERGGGEPGHAGEAPADLLTRARDAFDAADMAEALRLARSAPPVREADTLVGLASLFLKDYPGAEAAVERLRRRDPASVEADVVQGHLDIGRRSYPSAERLLRRAHAALEADHALGDAPDGRLLRRLAWVGLAWIASNEARFTEALVWSERAVALKPDGALALMARGNALVSVGRLKEARAVFETVLEVSPGDPYARAELGLLDYTEGRFREAEARFKAALATEGERYTCPYEGLGLVYLRTGRLEEAKRNFERAIEINPDVEFRKFNGLARIFLGEGKVEKARALLRKSIENYPFDPEAKALLATLPPPPAP